MTESDTFGAFIESTYDETLALLVDTREFLNSKPRAKDSGGREPKGLAETMSAISHLTWRMTELMSWLLLQKAIIGGEISREDAATQSSFKLPDIAIDDTRHDSPDIDLPVAVRGLIDRSRRIGDRAITRQDSINTAEIHQNRLKRRYSSPR